MTGDGRGATFGFYGEQFTEHEVALIAALAGDRTVDDEVLMQRVLNLRLMNHAKSKDAPSEGPPVELLIKLADALATGGGRVARLLRTKQMLTGEAGATLNRALDFARDVISHRKGIKV